MPRAVVLGLAAARHPFAGWSLVGRPGRPHGQAARTLDPRTRERLRKEGIEDQAIEDTRKRVASRIERAADWDDLIRILDSRLNWPSEYFSGLAASAAYRQLVNIEIGRPHLGERDWDSLVLLRLHARVEDLARDDQLGEVFDEILLSISKLYPTLGQYLYQVSLARLKHFEAFDKNMRA